MNNMCLSSSNRSFSNMYCVLTHINILDIVITLVIFFGMIFGVYIVELIKK